MPASDPRGADDAGSVPGHAGATTRSGVVVAGGRSRRFGDREKALARVGGRSMLRRVVDRLAGVVDELVVNCRTDQRRRFERALAPAHEVRFAVDPVADRGPLYGLRTGLHAVRGEYAAVAACDLPLLSPELVARLFTAASGEAGAVPVVDGVRRPLCAVYRVETAREACERAIASGTRRMQAVLDALEPVVVPEATVRSHCPPETLRSVNTPERLRSVEHDMIM